MLGDILYKLRSWPKYNMYFKSKPGVRPTDHSINAPFKELHIIDIISLMCAQKDPT